MYDAYHRVFERCGLTFRPVEAQSGEIGGDVNHEFMAVAAVGEDDFVWCRSCDYAANVEARRGAARHRRASPTATGRSTRRRWRRCTRPTCPGSRRSPSTWVSTPTQMLKCIAFDVDGELGLALGARRPRGQRVRAAGRAARRSRCALYGDDDFAAHPEVAEGLHRPASPRRRRSSSPTRRSRAPVAWVTGANEVDHHVRNARARPRLRGRRVGRPRDDRLRRRVPALRQPALGRPRHRGRPRVPARREVLRGARRAVHRRERRAAPDAHGVLRHRHLAHRRRGRRGVPRRARARVAGRARALRRARSSRCPGAANDAATVPPRPTESLRTS